MEISDETANDRDQFLIDVVMRLSREFGNRLPFAGVIDEKATAIFSQKGDANFPLSQGRENILGVQLSLSFSMIKQIENLLGNLSHVVLTFDRYELVLSQLVSNSIIYLICNKGSAVEIANMLTKLEQNRPQRRATDVVENKWSGH